jgi:hypothetical protein
MEDAFQPAFYSDNSHPDLQAVGASLKSGKENPVGIARRTFYFVRNIFPMGADLYQRKAQRR